jgi:hypothetical protein
LNHDLSYDAYLKKKPTHHTYDSLRLTKFDLLKSL